jgi:8-oxo-dGTP diphosphatase
VNTQRFKLVAAGHLVLMRGGDVLLLRRANTGWRDGDYSVIAGHLDGGESVRRSIAREAWEEGRILVEPEQLRVVHVSHRIENDEFGERMDFFLTTDDWGGEPANGEPSKCDDLRWFPLGALPANTIPYIRAALQHIARGVTFSEFGWADRTRA